MAVPSRVLVLSMMVAAAVAGGAQAKQLGGGQSVGTTHATTEPATAVAARVSASAQSSPLITSAGARAGMVTAALAGAATGTYAKVALADSQTAPQATERAAALAATEAKLIRLDQDAERLRAGEAAARKASDRLTDRSPEKAADKITDKAADKPADKAGVKATESTVVVDKPVVKTAAERRREQKEALEKVEREREEELRRVKLAREMSCRIEPVMTDVALMNCREVWRSL